MLSLSDSSLLVYRKATDFCILILNPETLVNSFITSNSLLVTSLEVSIYSIMSSKILTVLLFPSSLDAFYFSCLIAVARTFNRMVNRSGESGHPCLVPDFRGNNFSFSPLSMTLAVGLS